MKKIGANSQTIARVRNAARTIFYNGTYKFFWDGDELHLCFKKITGGDPFTFALAVQSLIEGLTVKYRVIDESDFFWQ